MSDVPRTLEAFRLTVCEGLTQASYSFTTAKHDWPPLSLFVQSPEGIAHANISQLTRDITGGNFTTAPEKDLARDIVRQTIASVGAYRYAVITNGHNLEAATDDDSLRLELYAKAGVRLETIPGSYELLNMALGDAEQEQVWHARILRDKRNRRRLGPWEASEADNWIGRFVNVNDLLRAPQR